MNIGTEGRFGIGFKFWTYHFNYATLEAENWSCKWKQDLTDIKLSSSNQEDGMRLIFQIVNRSQQKENYTSFVKSIAVWKKLTDYYLVFQC